MVVTGPTPPGTGVMALTTGRNAAKSTSPTMPSGVVLMPQSMTTAERLTISERIRSGLTGGHHQDLGAPGLARQVAGATVRDLTVASAPSRREATGRPTTAERPTTTARLPAIGIS